MLNGTSALVRIARREARRHRRRSALIVALIALPVAVVAAGLAVTVTSTVTPAEARPQELGRADLLVGDPQGGEVEKALVEGGGVSPEMRDEQAARIDRALRAAVPPGSDVAPTSLAWPDVAGGARSTDVEAVATDATDPVNEGRFRLDRGRMPERPGEVALAPRVARRLHVGVGDRVTVYLHPGETQLRVVGLARTTAALYRDLVILPPGTIPTTGWFVDLPDGADPDTVAASLAHDPALGGVQARTADDVLQASGVLEGLGMTSVWYIIGGLALAWTGVVAGATFAIGARRRLREVGLVAVSGGTERQVRRLLVSDGLVLGLVGSLVGVAVGLAVAPSVLGYLDPWAERDAGSFDVPILAELGTVALGTAAATLAAWWPARRAARMPTTAALEGRITRPPRRVRSTVGGAAAMGTGAVVLTAGAAGEEVLPVLVGTLLLVAGVAMLHRLLVDGVARVARQAPLAVRFAARDASRQASRTGPAVVASMLALAAAVAAATIIATVGARERAASADVGNAGRLFEVTWDTAGPRAPDGPDGASLVPGRDGPRLGAAVTGAVDARRTGLTWWTMPGSADFEQGGPALEPKDSPGVAVANEDVLTLLGVTDEEALAAFGHGAALRLDPSAPSGLRLAGGSPLQVVDAGGGARDAAWMLGPLVVSPETAARAGLTEAGSVTVVVDLGRRVDDDDAALAHAAALRASGGGMVWVATRGGAQSDGWATWVAAGLGLAIALPVLGLVAGLTRSEARAELAVLDAVGVGPRRRRRMTATATGLLAAFASALAVPAGLVPALLFLRAVDTNGPGVRVLSVPWGAVALVVVGTPLVLAALGWLTAGRPRPLAALRP